MSDRPKFFKWTIEVEVAEVWVEDGFDFNKDRCVDLETSLIDWASEGEVRVKVVKAPDPKEIRKTQGYEA
jgi:hypothetical protein